MTKQDLYRWMVSGGRWDIDTPLTQEQELAAKALMGDRSAFTRLMDQAFAADTLWGEKNERSQILGMLATLIRKGQFAFRARTETDEKYKTTTNPAGELVVFQVVIDQVTVHTEQAKCGDYFPPKPATPATNDNAALLAALALKKQQES